MRFQPEQTFRWTSVSKMNVLLVASELLYSIMSLILPFRSVRLVILLPELRLCCYINSVHHSFFVVAKYTGFVIACSKLWYIIVEFAFVATRLRVLVPV